jgi:hypothetical protein
MENNNQDCLLKYKDELVTLLHKSQDTFEKQLSYISAGSLALSIGYIKDVVKNLESASCRWMLAFGWILLAFTILVNCISHIRAADLHNKTIGEINSGEYDQLRVIKRFGLISKVNWLSVGTLVGGILFITFFVIINLLSMQNDKQPNPPKQNDLNKGYVPSSPPPTQSRPDSTHGYVPSTPPPNPVPSPKPKIDQ